MRAAAAKVGTSGSNFRVFQISAGAITALVGLFGARFWFEPPATVAGFVCAGLGLAFAGGNRRFCKETSVISAGLAVTLIVLSAFLLNGSPAIALAFAMIGMALLLVNFAAGVTASQALGFSATFTAFFPIVGYTFRVPGLYSLAGVALSLPAAILVAALGAGVVCIRPDWGIARLMTSRVPGGAIARRLLLLPFAFPILLVFFVRVMDIVKLQINVAAGLDTSVLILMAIMFLAGPMLWAAGFVQQAESQELRTSEERYRRLFESTPQPMWVVEPETQRFLSVNPAAIQSYGYSLSDFMSMTLPDLRAGPDRHRKKDGTIIDVEVTGHDIDFGGRPAHLEFPDDVTEKKKLEQQLLRAQRMESVGTLAGGIAHDLNNVLAPILMAVQMLKDSPENSVNRPYIEALEQSAQRGAAIVRQIVTFARGLEGNRTTVLPGDSIDGITQIIGGTFPKSIRIQVDKPADLWSIAADPAQLDQVLINLCVNARDAMAGGGKLKIVAANRVLDVDDLSGVKDSKPGSYVMIEVEDSGAGIPSEIIDKVFEPFFTTKAVGKGTGLGLSTVRSIVKAHGGFVQAHSEAGKGATFRVFFPALESHNSQDLPPGISQVWIGNGETILVVDDEAAICDITRITLESYNYRVITAADGAEAVKLYMRHRSEIQAVVIDMMMPVMDGIAAIRAIRRVNPDARIIAASGLTETIQPSDAGAILSKPYTASELLKTLREVLTNHSVLA